MDGDEALAPVWEVLGVYPEVMTTREVAAVLRLTRQTVCRLAERGEIKGFRAGRSWRFLRQDVVTAMRTAPTHPIEGLPPS